MRDFENTTLGIKVVVKDLDLELLGGFLSKLELKPNIPIDGHSGAIVIAALGAGLLVDPAWTPDQVSKQKPALIHWLAQNIIHYIGERLDKLPSNALGCKNV